jgi:DNA-binding LacI/PurR family transcriptional regulator
VTGIRGLARHLDLSIGTVSRALNDRADVNPQTRARVLAAAARLGYAANQSGRSLRRGQTDLVGVVVPSGGDQTLIDPVFLSVLDGLRRHLLGFGLDLAIFLHGEDEDLFGSLRRLTERGLVDGLILSNTRRVDPRIAFLVERKRPFVAFGRSLTGVDHPWVDPDFEAAVEAAVGLLVARGHRRIALALPPGDVNYLHLIGAAFEAAMARRGLGPPPGFVERRPRDEAGGEAAAAALLAAGAPPTAILVSDSLQAIGLYRRLAAAGLAPGRDISVIGLLPEDRARILVPALTVVETDWHAIGGRLGAALVAAMGREGAGASRGVLQFLAPVALREGASVHRPAPAARAGDADAG